MDDDLKVLVIDDSDIARQSITHTLREAGMTVIERSSPIGATRDILRNGVEVVILDVEMPALSGDKLARLIRSNSGIHVALVLVSSLDERELQRLAAEAGADAYVPKGRVTQDLVRTVRRLRERTQA